MESASGAGPSWLCRLQIENLRIVTRAELEPRPGLNLIHGPNGAGKTTLLEAIHLLGRGRSFRAGGPAEWIRRGEKAALVHGRLAGPGGETVLGLERRRQTWRARVDAEEVRRLSALARRLPLVVLEPGLHELVEGSPERRRNLLDWVAFHVKPDWHGVWNRHERVLRQRNRLLKQQRPDRRALASLDELLAEAGTRLTAARETVIAELAARIGPLQAELAPELAPISLVLRPGWDRHRGLDRVLADHRDRDLIRGRTGAGAHRDDLELGQGGQPARHRLSRGQQKLTAVLLHAAAWATLRSQGQEAIILADDLPSELDRRHQKPLVQWLASHPHQVFLTTVSGSVELEDAAAAVFHVEQGRVRRTLPQQ